MLLIVGWTSETPIVSEADRDALNPVAGRFRFAFLPKNILDGVAIAMQ
jgi:hypothetical protein